MPRNWKNARFGSARGFVARQLLKLNHYYWRDIEQLSVDELREQSDRLAKTMHQPPDSIHINDVVLDSLTVQHLEMGDEPKTRALLYVHGGGFIGGSPDTTHVDYLWRLAEEIDCAVYAPFYRKSPEYLYPAALDDIYKSYQYLVEKYGVNNLVIGGDSSGGGLALALLLKLKQEGLTLPMALVLVSPWVDLKGTGMSVITNWATDNIVPGHLLRQIAALYLGTESPDNPLASPLYGDFEGLPPTLIQVSDTEVLLDDSRRLAEKMEEAGVIVKLDIWHNQPHVWHLMARWVPESREAIRDIAGFLNQHWKRSSWLNNLMKR